LILNELGGAAGAFALTPCCSVSYSAFSLVFLFAFFTLKGLTLSRLSHIILISEGDIMTPHEVFEEFFYLVRTEPASQVI
jgi:hypothetical protein